MRALDSAQRVHKERERAASDEATMAGRASARRTMIERRRKDDDDDVECRYDSMFTR